MSTARVEKGKKESASVTLGGSCLLHLLGPLSVVSWRVRHDSSVCCRGEPLFIRGWRERLWSLTLPPMYMFTFFLVNFSGFPEDWDPIKSNFFLETYWLPKKEGTWVQLKSLRNLRLFDSPSFTPSCLLSFSLVQKLRRKIYSPLLFSTRETDWTGKSKEIIFLRPLTFSSKQIFIYHI